MQTIKIYLKESGSVAELVKDFNLYAGSYQNKLLDVYVPTSILYTATDIDNAVKVGGLLIAPNGSQVTTKSYYLNFVRNEVVFDEFAQKNIEYAVYERLLPKEFTLFSGNQSIVTNVVAIDNTDAEKSVIKQVVTTQTSDLVVQESAYLDEEETIEPSELDVISAKTNENTRNIVDLKDRITNVETDITTSLQDISGNKQEIENIKKVVGTGQDYIGTLTVISNLPEPSVLNEFVYQEKQREAKGGDTIIVIVSLDNETDKSYKYIYNGDEWSYYEIPPVELAGNGTAGLIWGNNGIEDTRTIVDIVGGKIVSISVRDNRTMVPREIGSFINSNKKEIDEIVDGEKVVGEAINATNDNLGNNIASTYLTKEYGATKEYVKDYALPKQFNDVSYISNDGYSEKIPNISFEVPTNASSEVLFDITKTANAKFQISNKNSYTNSIYISANRGCIVGFRLVTKIKGTIANIEIKEEVILNENTITKVVFNDTFDYLEENVLNIKEDDTIQQTLEIIPTIDGVTFTFYSNTIYPSKFYLNTQLMVIASAQEGGILSLSSEQMDNYIVYGGIKVGQLVVCNETSTPNYTQGSLYRFDTGPNYSYIWVELAAGGTKSKDGKFLFRDYEVIDENGHLYTNVFESGSLWLMDRVASMRYVEQMSNKQIILGADGVIEENVYNFTVENVESYIPYRTNGTKFLVDLHLPVVGEIDNTKEVTITFGDTSYYVYNILKGAQRVTIGDLRQVNKYNNTTGYRFIVEMTFFENSDITGFAIIPTVSISDVLSLTSDEMDSYMADGGLTQGQLAICKKVITNGYTEGGLYRFDITYPDTYTWTELSAGVKLSDLPTIEEIPDDEEV